MLLLFTWQASLCRFSKLKLTYSYQQMLGTMDTLGENHNIELIKARERITAVNMELHKLNEKIKNLNNFHAAHLSSSLPCNCNQELSAIRKQVFDLEKSTHPGFVIPFDNLDFQLQRKSMSMQSQNRDYHWINHWMIENRVSGVHLNSQGPTSRKFQTSNFYPNLKTISDKDQTTSYLGQGSWLTTLMLWLL